jgi:hypothetical protein
VDKDARPINRGTHYHLSGASERNIKSECAIKAAVKAAIKSNNGTGGIKMD